MIYKIDIEKVRSLLEELRENGTSGPDAEQAVEKCQMFLEDLCSQYDEDQANYFEGYRIRTDFHGKRFVAMISSCGDFCERNGCNGACKTYLDQP